MRRLRMAANAEAIREAVLADQENGRAEELAKIEAEKAEAIDLPVGFVIGRPVQRPADAASERGPGAPADAAMPATARPAKPEAARKPVEPTPVPTPAETMPSMSRATARLYMEAAGGVMPAAPDFSKPSYACDRGRLAELVKLAEAGDVAGLRAYGIRVFYSGAQALDRFRHRAIIALEARQAQRAAA
jgi:hypothetical protein